MAFRVCQKFLTSTTFPRLLRTLQVTAQARMSSDKPKVLVTRCNIPDEAMQILRKQCEVEVWDKETTMPRDALLKAAKGKDALFVCSTERMDRELLDAAGPSLKVIGTFSVGHDHIDVPEVKARGIKVGYTPGVLTAATAELTVAVLLATSRRLFECHQELIGGGWISWNPMWMIGHGLEDSTVGIVGLGRIGQTVLEMLKPFRVSKFLYCGRSAKPEGEKLGAEFVSFNDLLKASDFVIVTCPLNDETREMFDEKAFDLMKPTAVFVNSSRGGVVKQEALVDALKKKKIWAAGLDVMTPEPLPPNHELTKLPNCVLIPHMGSATIQARTKMSTLTAKNIVCALENRPLPAQLC